MQQLFERRFFVPLYFCALFILLVILWIPGLKYPILSDTAFYSFLGESMWTDWRYELLDIPYAKHLPFHAFVSYPFVWMLGHSLGMKVSTLLAGFAMLLGTFFLFDKTMSRKVAVWSTVFLALNHAFVLMMQLGSADLLFSALCVFAIYGYVCAEDNRRFYALTFIAAGLACVTRYNGVPLFGFLALHFLLYRRGDLLDSFSVFGSILAGGLLFVLWLVRNWSVFGSPLYTDYTSELSTHTSGYVSQILSNLLYYLNPFHNFLPVLMLCAAWGVYRFGRQYGFLLCAAVSLWVLTSFWWVQAMRFAFPGYIILMGFAVCGLLDIGQRIRSGTLFAFVITAILSLQAGALCLYAYGECNARMDAMFDVLPKNMGLTSEGFYAWHRARLYLEEHAQSGSTLLVSDPAQSIIWNAEHVAGEGITVTHESTCDAYRIRQNPDEEDEILFTTEEFPQTSVVLQRCP